jgi:hypothetical protein
MSPHFHGMYPDPVFLMGLFPVSFNRYTPLSMVELKVSLLTPCRHIGEVEE